MEDQEKDLLTDPGDWYSELFKEDTKSEKNRKIESEKPCSPGLYEDLKSAYSDDFAYKDVPVKNGKEKQEGHQADINEDKPTHVFLFFSFAVIIFLFAVFFLFQIGDSERAPVGYFTKSSEKYVTSYLSHNARVKAQGRVFLLLKKNKAQLNRIENELALLEKEKDHFLNQMEQKEKLFDTQKSIFGLKESQKNIQSIAALVENNVEFKGEVKRRVSQYTKIYENRKLALIKQQLEYEQNLKRLTQFYKEIGDGKQSGIPFYSMSSSIDALKREYIDRFFYYIENDEFGEAINALEALDGLHFNANERALLVVLQKMLPVVKEYRESIDFLKFNSPFDDIKLSYLSENYSNAAERASSLEGNEFIKPILSGLQGAFDTNIVISGEINHTINQNMDLMERIEQAEGFEKKGEYKKALAIYEDILIFRLQSYDKEFVINKIHSLWLPIAMQSLKRQENTKAIKYMESARILSREGSNNEALRYFRMLVKECPNSDYVEEALDEIAKVAALNKTPG